MNVSYEMCSLSPGLPHVKTACRVATYWFAVCNQFMMFLTFSDFN